MAQTPNQSKERGRPGEPEPKHAETEGQKDAEDGIPGYGQPPPGVRTDKLEESPDFDWDGKGPAQRQAP